MGRKRRDGCGTVPNSRALGAGAAGTRNMPETCAATFNPRRNLDMRSGVPEKSFPSLFSGRDCESRRCPLRSAWRNYVHDKLETRGGREVARRANGINGKKNFVGCCLAVLYTLIQTRMKGG